MNQAQRLFAEGRIRQHVAGILRELKAVDTEPRMLDLANTPKRVAKMLVRELCAGYSSDERELDRQMRTFPSEGGDSMVVQTDIAFTSMCAHHMLPFSGYGAIGYLPGKKLVGLSKLGRVLDFYAARLQMQERLGNQVASYLYHRLKAQAVFVLLQAEHFCMACRGVKKSGVTTSTTSLYPKPPQKLLLDEFYGIVGLSRRRV